MAYPDDYNKALCTRLSCIGIIYYVLSCSVLYCSVHFAKGVHCLMFTQLEQFSEK